MKNTKVTTRSIGYFMVFGNHQILVKENPLTAQVIETAGPVSAHLHAARGSVVVVGPDVAEHVEQDRVLCLQVRAGVRFRSTESRCYATAEIKLGPNH